MVNSFFDTSSRSRTGTGRKAGPPERFIEVERNGDGLNQVGRLLNLTQESKSEVEAHVKGKIVFKHCLKPAGWTTPNSDKLDSHHWFMMLAPGITDPTSAIEGTDKFYSYEAVCSKYKSDEEFRKMYPGGQDIQQTLNELLYGGTEPSGASSETENPAYSGLGRPTPGVAIAARVPVDEDEPMATKVKKTSTATKKRARSPKSQQKSKRRRLAPTSLGGSDIKVAISRKELLERARLANEETAALLKAIENEKLKKQLAKLRNQDEEISAEKKLFDWEHEKERIKQKIAKLRKENES